MKHCIVTCFASCLDRVLETGNMLNEDMGFLIKLLIVNLSSQSKLYFHKVSWRLVGSPLPVFKGECCLLLLLASQSVETYCLHADWIFALWGVNPPSSSKGMLHSFLKFWLANQESKPLRANEWMPLVENIHIHLCLLPFVQCLNHIKAKLRYSMIRLQETYCKLVLLRFWWDSIKVSTRINDDASLYWKLGVSHSLNAGSIKVKVNQNRVLVCRKDHPIKSFVIIGHQNHIMVNLSRYPIVSLKPQFSSCVKTLSCL